MTGRNARTMHHERRDDGFYSVWGADFLNEDPGEVKLSFLEGERLEALDPATQTMYQDLRARVPGVKVDEMGRCRTCKKYVKPASEAMWLGVCYASRDYHECTGPQQSEFCQTPGCNYMKLVGLACTHCYRNSPADETDQEICDRLRPGKYTRGDGHTLKIHRMFKGPLTPERERHAAAYSALDWDWPRRTADLTWIDHHPHLHPDDYPEHGHCGDSAYYSEEHHAAFKASRKTVNPWAGRVSTGRIPSDKPNLSNSPKEISLPLSDDDIFTIKEWMETAKQMADLMGEKADEDARRVLASIPSVDVRTIKVFGDTLDTESMEQIRKYLDDPNVKIFCIETGQTLDAPDSTDSKPLFCQHPFSECGRVATDGDRCERHNGKYCKVRDDNQPCSHVECHPSL